MGRMARWHEKLQDYNFKILHIPGRNNTPADVLSQPNNEECKVEDRQLSLIPPHLFLNIADADSVDFLESLITNSWHWHKFWLMTRKGAYCLKEKQGL